MKPGFGHFGRVIHRFECPFRGFELGGHRGPMPFELPPECKDLVAGQARVMACWQAKEAGLDAEKLKSRVRSGNGNGFNVAYTRPLPASRPVRRSCGRHCCAPGRTLY